MPFVQITVALTPAMQAISKALAGVLSKPEAVVMAHLNLDQPMLSVGSDTPCTMTRLRSIGKVDLEHNPTIVGALTEAVSGALSVPVDRIFMNLDDVDRTKWGKGSSLVLAPSSLPVAFP